MAREDSFFLQPNGDAGYRVPAPRVSDAIGLALRDAYEDDMGLPGDMAAMLRQLDKGSGSDAR